jgi:hypothetical protein
VVPEPGQPGRPTEYKPDIADAIVLGIAEGRSLKSICRGVGMPPESTVRHWVVDDREGFSARYARARAMGIESLLDETDELIIQTGVSEGFGVGNAKVQKAKLLVENRRWFASKLLPGKYGDISRFEHSGPGGGAIRMQAIRSPEALISDAVRLGLVDRLPPALRELAERGGQDRDFGQLEELSSGNTPESGDNAAENGPACSGPPSEGDVA